jgi:FkbM family methyltransferase
MRPGPIDVEVFGLTVRLLPPFKGSARHILLSPHRSERQERAFLARHMTPAGVFLDIGGNKGFYTFWAAGAFPQATVHTFEPRPSHAEMLQFNVTANQLQGRVKVHQVALADRRGSASFGLETESLAYGEGATIDVPTAPLLDILDTAGVQHVDAIKIDVEGVEDKVLMPFFRAAPRALWPRAIIIEHCCADYWAENPISFAMANGYTTAFTTTLNTALQLSA